MQFILEKQYQQMNVLKKYLLIKDNMIILKEVYLLNMDLKINYKI